MRKKTGVTLGVGGSSILVIFVLLCLTTFATLSLVSANADLRLTRRTAEAAEAYYGADTRAEERLAEIDALLAAAAQSAGDGDGYHAACRAALSALEGVSVEEAAGELTVSYQEPVSEERRLEVVLRVGEAGSGERYELVRWQDVNIGEWVEDDSITLWTPESAG